MSGRMWLVGVAWLALASTGHAELTKLEILRREPFAEGMDFGKIGSYVKLTGIAHYALDPAHPRNRVIVDLEHAPRNAAGKVEYSADVVILMPSDPRRGNGAILYDVNNRGNRPALGIFNQPPNGAPGELGDGKLMWAGYTVVWSGWDGELLPGNGRLLLKPPIAQQDGQPIRGVVRYETMTDRPADSAPLNYRENHGAYPPTERGEREAVLTVRERETDPRQPVPREQWSLVRGEIPAVQGAVAGTLPPIRLKVQGGLQPGKIYEVIYEGQGPIVQGVGFAAIRDLVSFLRHDRSKANPLAVAGQPTIQRALAFGVSQSGRVLRHFLYRGFNADLAGRPVFEGMMIHVSGGGLGSFNHRFAQPTRSSGQHLEHRFYCDAFPFTYGPSELDGRTDSILGMLTANDPKCVPKIFHTSSAAEYWHRAGSLVHTDPAGTKDAAIPENVRIYTFGGTQHGPAAYPPKRAEIADHPANPANFRPFLRALLVALDDWVQNQIEPPASIYPRIDKQTLVPIEKVAFPKVPSVRFPTVLHTPKRLDFGPDFATRGIITHEPPRELGQFRTLVPQCDASGNDLGCLLLPEVAVPVATYTGWNLRSKAGGGDGELLALTGSYIPFAKTALERQRSGDSRPSLAERYPSFADYSKRLGLVCRELVKARWLNADDAEQLEEQAKRYRSWFEP
jgi:hypothetical protein